MGSEGKEGLKGGGTNCRQGGVVEGGKVSPGTGGGGACSGGVKKGTRAKSEGSKGFWGEVSGIKGEEIRRDSSVRGVRKVKTRGA